MVDRKVTRLSPNARNHRSGKLGAAALTLALVGAAVPAGAQSPPEPPAIAPGSQPQSAPLPPQPQSVPPPAPASAPPALPKPASTSTWKPPKKEPPPPPLPDAPARLWIIAPGPLEPWTMRIDNEGAKAIRVPADIRLLSFEIEVPANDPKQPRKKPTVYKCAVPSSMRPTNFPESRGLLLGPGQSYVESFDPRLFCFGKNAAALVGSATVRTRFGWDPPPKWSLAAKKPPVPPFAAEGTENPATTTPLKQLTAPTMVLSFWSPPPANAAERPPAAAGTSATPAERTSASAGTSATPAERTSAAATTTPAPGGTSAGSTSGTSAAPGMTPAAAAATSAAPGMTPAGPAATSAAPGMAPAGVAASSPAASGTPGGDSPAPPGSPAPAPIVDANAPRLAVSTPTYTDAGSTRSASVTVDVHNAGGRAMFAALRPRMISFQIVGPDRIVTCSSSPPTRAIPRDLYREYKPAAKTSFTVLLNEVCPDDVFSRPGLYRVTATIWANESGSELGLNAFTGRATGPAPTILRLQSAREPFYRDPPKAVATPKPEMPEDDGETSP